MELTDKQYGGDGYGYGYGDGYGDGKEQYFNALLSSHNGNRARKIAFWRSNLDGTPANGGTGTKARAGLVEEIAGPLTICTKNALHGTLDPSKWKGERWWLVELHEPVQKQDDKLGSLKRKILKDLGKCPF